MSFADEFGYERSEASYQMKYKSFYQWITSDLQARTIFPNGLKNCSSARTSSCDFVRRKKINYEMRCRIQLEGLILS